MNSLELKPASPKQTNVVSSPLVLGSGLIKSTIQGLRPDRQTDRGQVVSSQPVVARCDTPEVLQPVECTLDAPAELVEALAEAERLLSVAAVGNDRFGSTLIELVAQFSAVVGL